MSVPSNRGLTRLGTINHRNILQLIHYFAKQVKFLLDYREEYMLIEYLRPPDLHPAKEIIPNCQNPPLCGRKTHVQHYMDSGWHGNSLLTIHSIDLAEAEKNV